MVRSVASKVMWVGRATVLMVGLAVILALMFGVASAAFGANGGNFILGSLDNRATAISRLIGNVDGGPALQVVNNNTAAGSRALQLNVAQGKPPLTVNPTAGKATNLNADKLDGKDATEIGVNGWQRVEDFSASNSDSPKIAGADCPSGKILVGHGFDIPGGKRGSSPDAQTDVVIDTVLPYSTGVIVEAFEEEPTSAEWGVAAWAICATAP